jgi:hypothetical protein
MGEWRYISTILILDILWLSGRIHAPAALSPVKEPPVHIGQEAGWAPEPIWTLWRRKKFSTLPVIEPQPFSM